MNTKRDVFKRILPLIIIVLVCLSCGIILLNNANIYQNNSTGDNKSDIGNSSITKDERYSRCFSSSCLSFGSLNYICKKGDKITVKVIVNDSNNRDDIKSFKLSNNNISKIEKYAASGGDHSVYTYEVSCKKIGTTEMTVIGGNGKKTNAIVKVVENLVPVKGINIGKSKFKMNVGSSKVFNVQFNPINASNTNLRWYTSNSQVIKVNQEGKITALSEGQARVTAIAWNDDKVYYESHIDIIVSLKDKDPYISFNTPSYVCGVGSSIAVKSTICNDDLKKVSSESSKIATITTFSNNVKYCGVNAKCMTQNLNKACKEYTHVVNCKVAGTTRLLLKSALGRTASSSIKVVNNYINVSSLSLGDYGFRNLKVKDSFTLSTNVNPSNASNKKVYWSSSNPDAFIVDQEGTITAVGKGRSEIIAKIYYDDNIFVSDAIEFNAYQNEKDITPDDMIYFNRLKGNCKVGKSIFVTLHLTYSDVKNIKLVGQIASVKSLDTKIATNKKKKNQLNRCLGCTDYEIKCKKAGTATIEATTTKGGKAKYELFVNKT